MTLAFGLIRRSFLTLAAASALALGAAQAQTAAPAQSEPIAPAAATAQRLTIRDVYDRLEATGYRDIREIELDHGRYEVKARNAKGQRVELKVDSHTGVVERERIDH